MGIDEENETFGPKVGIKLSIAQADLIAQRHLNLQATNLLHINRGYNNRVYIVTTSDGQEFILRLSGRFWTRCKTENEVAALVYISKKRPLLRIPKIFGYCTDKDKSGVNAEYILMEKLPGEPLENIWKELSTDEKLPLLDQLAEMFSNIQNLSFDQIGSFCLRNLIGETFGIGINPEKDITPEHLQVSKGVEFEGGPFNTYLEYFKSSSETEIEYLRTCAFMQEVDGYEQRLKRIEKFISSFEKLESVPEVLREAMENVPFVFTHGDYEPRNLLVDRETMRITGVLDWEFSGAYPVDEDWFTGFRFADADTSDSRVFNDMPGEVNDRSEPEVVRSSSQSVRDYFLAKLKQNGAKEPDIIAGHMIRAELYYFKGFICPWWLREERNPIPDTHYAERKNACEKVDYVLGKYGF